MSDVDLIAYIGGGCRRGVAELARDGSAFDKHLYQTRLKCARQHLRWRGLKMPAKPTKAQPVTPAKRQRTPVAVQRPHAIQPDLFADAPAGLVERLWVLKEQRSAAAAA